MVLLAITASILLGLISASPLPPARRQQVRGARIKTPQGLCLSPDPAAEVKNGTKVGLATCDIRKNPYADAWNTNYGNDAVIFAYGSALCLDASTVNTTHPELYLRDCVESWPAQSWYFSCDGHIGVTNGTICVESVGNHSVRAAACSMGNPTQTWVPYNMFDMPVRASPSPTPTSQAGSSAASAYQTFYTRP